jgi:two-component system OmpR family sensor kinase
VRLRTTLTLGILVATTATFVVVGFVAIPGAKGTPRERIDDRLRADLPVVRAAVLAADRPGALAPAAFGGREHAVILLEGSRATVLARSGLAADRDPPPELTGVRDLAGPSAAEYAQAADGTRYRYVTAPLGDGRRVAVAAPVDDLRALVDELIWRFAVIGLAGGGALALVSWWWIRRSTRPIERLTERADAIARGDGDRSLAVPASTTELRRLAHALDAMITSMDASEARLREFVADASHELRTPLTSISGYLQLDLDGALEDDDAHRRAIGRALAEAGRMRRIVADLQLLTELDEDILPVMHDVDLNRVVLDAVDDFTAVDPRRAWVADTTGEPLPVRADPDQLRQVLANLLANIRVHTPPGTAATVTTGACGDAAMLWVCDTGPGVPADELPRLFDRFWRHDLSRDRASGGSGLGLSIVDAIVRAHGGTISAALGDAGGLTVRIELPAAPRVAAGRLTADETTR